MTFRVSVTSPSQALYFGTSAALGKHIVDHGGHPHATLTGQSPGVSTPRRNIPASLA